MLRTTAADHDEKRHVILGHAAQVFAQKGYDVASVNQVAQACGISKANVYHYYSSKDAILFDILHDYLGSLRDRICGQDLFGLPPGAQFRTSVTEILLTYQGADDQNRLHANSLDRLSEDQQKTLLVFQRDLVAHLENLISNLAPDTFEKNTKKLRATTMAVFGMLNWFYMWTPDAGTAARVAYADTICTLCLKGIPGL